MSRKLVTLIQDNPRLSAKYKRVLEAYAAHANNDGTNIFASKEKVAKKVSLGRSAVYNNTPDLIRAGILVQATSHTCRVEACNKGGTHYWGQQGKYTVVYNINLSALQDDTTYLLLNQLKVPVPKQLNLFVRNQQKDGVRNLDATQALRTTPAPLGKEHDSSALTSGVRKQESETGSLAHLTDESEKPENLQTSEVLGDEAKQGQEQHQHQYQHQHQHQHQEHNLPQTVEEFWCGDTAYEARELMYLIKPNLTDDLVKRDVPIVLQALDTMGEQPHEIDAHDLIKWNHLHKTGKLYIRSAQQFLNAVTTGELTLLNDYDQHNFEKCPICLTNGLLHTETVRKQLEEEERKREEKRLEEQWQEIRKSYVWDRERIDDDRKVFAANRKFPKERIFETFGYEGNKTPTAILNVAIIYFASLNRPFGWDEFHSVFIDIWKVWSQRHRTPIHTNRNRYEVTGYQEHELAYKEQGFAAEAQ
jgi:hypothetical protein